MRGGDHVRIGTQLLVQLEVRASWSPHDIHHFLRELERTRLHAEGFAWGQSKHESKVDVDDVTLSIKHDVAVVPILYRGRYDTILEAAIE